MASSSEELPRVDAELESLASGIDLERAWAQVRAAPRMNLERIDEALDALGTDVVVVAPRRSERRPPSVEVAIAEPVSVDEPAPEVVAVEPEAQERDADLHQDPDPVVADVSAEALLNPFEEPSEDAFEDDQTMIIDASELGGLDMDALFDGMVEDALSAPLEEERLLARSRTPRPSTDPPPSRRAALVEGATDIEQLRPDGEDDLELFVDDDAIGIDHAEALEALEAPEDGAIADSDGDDDDAPKKKGFFKKLFG
jgi:hypothetical protein